MARDFLGESPAIKVDNETFGSKWLTVDSAGFSKNLAPADDTAQKCLVKFDALSVPSNTRPGGGYVSGRYYDQSAHAQSQSSATTLAVANNNLFLSPFLPHQNLTIDRIGISITIAKNGNAQFLIYANGTDNWPSSRLYQSGSISTAVSTYAFASLSFSFSRDVQYWVGVHTSANPTIHANLIDSSVSLGLMSNTGTDYANVIKKTITYGTAPNPWVFSSADLASSIVPSIRMRAV